MSSGCGFLALKSTRLRLVPAPLKDAMNEALRYWVTNAETHFYIIGTVAGPHPYPQMVRDFQSVIGTEARKQILEAEGRLPNKIVACIGGGSNAMGLFYPFLMIKTLKFMVLKRLAKASQAGCMPPL